MLSQQHIQPLQFHPHTEQGRPHPISDMEMWGSKPDSAWSIGTDSAAISRDWSNMNTMNQAFMNYINKGFKILKNI